MSLDTHQNRWMRSCYYTLLNKNFKIVKNFEDCNTQYYIFEYLALLVLLHYLTVFNFFQQNGNSKVTTEHREIQTAQRQAQGSERLPRQFAQCVPPPVVS